MDTTVSSRHGGPSSMLVSGGGVPLQPRQTFMRLETCLVQIISQAQPGWPVIWGSPKIGAARRLYWSDSVRKYRGVVHVRDWITTPMPKWPCLNAKMKFPSLQLVRGDQKISWFVVSSSRSRKKAEPPWRYTQWHTANQPVLSNWVV